MFDFDIPTFFRILVKDNWRRELGITSLTFRVHQSGISQITPGWVRAALLIGFYPVLSGLDCCMSFVVFFYGVVTFLNI